jgi:hypothetical protein
LQSKSVRFWALHTPGVADPKRGYRWGCKRVFKNDSANIHAGCEPSLERFHTIGYDESLQEEILEGFLIGSFVKKPVLG